MRLDWSGRRCFVVGGGPSLRGFDWDRLRGERVLAINASALYAPATACLALDRRVVEDLFRATGRPECPIFWPRLVGADDRPAPAGVVEIRGVDGPLGRGPWSGTWPEVAWSSHAGPVALNLAQLFGPSRIYLLGFDYARDLGANFHREYAIWDDDPADPFPVWRRDLERFAHHVPETRIVGRSALECFERVTLEEALHE